MIVISVLHFICLSYSKHPLLLQSQKKRKQLCRPNQHRLLCAALRHCWYVSYLSLPPALSVVLLLAEVTDKASVTAPVTFTVALVGINNLLLWITCLPKFSVFSVWEVTKRFDRIWNEERKKPLTLKRYNNLKLTIICNSKRGCSFDKKNVIRLFLASKKVQFVFRFRKIHNVSTCLSVCSKV